jgi:hypothetical protein
MRVPKREIALRTAKTTGQRQNSPGKSIEQAYCGRRRRILPTEGPFLCMRQTYTVLGRVCGTAALGCAALHTAEGGCAT